MGSERALRWIALFGVVGLLAAAPAGTAVAQASAGADASSGPLTLAGPIGELKSTYAVSEDVGPASFSVTGGDGPYSWTVAGDDLPPGVTMTMDEGGAAMTLGGAILAAGSYGPYAFRVVDSAGHGRTAAFGWSPSTVEGAGPPVAGEPIYSTVVKTVDYEYRNLTAKGGEPYFDPSSRSVDYAFRYSTDAGETWQSEIVWDGLVFDGWGAVRGRVSEVGTLSGALVAAVDSRGVQGPARPFAVAAVDATVAATMTTAPVLRAGEPVLADLFSEMDASWTFAQDPPSPPLSLGNPDYYRLRGSLASASDLTARTTFTITATARRSGGADYARGTSFAVTMVPLLKLSGPSGAQSGTVDRPFASATPAVLQGLEGEATFDLLQQTGAVDIAELCPGLSFSGATGVVSGTPAAVCSLPNLFVRVTDSFDGATASSSRFSISVGP